MNSNPPESASLLPPALRRPFWLLFSWILPQVILLLLNARSWWLVAGEATSTGMHDALWLGIAEVGLLAIGVITFAWMTFRGAKLDWLHGVAILIAHAAYLWAFVALCDHIIPRQIPEWIVSRGMIIYHHFAFVMPALLHSALLIACFGARRSRGVEIARSLALTVGIPVIWFLALQVGDVLFRNGPGAVIVTLLLVLLAGSTALLIMAVLRLLFLIWDWMAAAGDHGRLVVLTLVGLVGPVGGLMLNHTIPFPADFQAAMVYALAILNGVTLLLPVEQPRLTHQLIWLTQCCLFAFTCYFMLVFLPFLPLSILAIIAMGTGFLMLVPLALFALHARQLIRGWRSIQGAHARRWACLGLLAFALLPAAYVVRAYGDRATLHAAIDHVYNPDYERGGFTGNPDVVKRGLERLRDFKAGIQLPFLSGFYNHIVFGGLVLPNAKIEHLYRVFCGQSLPKPAENSWGGSLFGRPSRFRGRTPPLPPQTVQLVSLDAVRGVEQDCETALVKLVLTNTSSNQAEYVTTMHLPAGVFVMGYWLNVNGQRVPGRIFEKKTALWVYEMIRDQTRRDPGILLYRDPQTVEMRVFPFASGETRTTELELMWPAGLQPQITIAGRDIDTRSDSPRPPAVSVVHRESSGALALVAPISWNAQSLAVPGAPYLHVILDASLEANPVEQARAIAAATHHHENAREVVVSAANFEFETMNSQPEPVDQLEAIAAHITLPRRGGFRRDHALKCALDWHAAHAPDRPVILMIFAGSTNTLVTDEDLAFFAAWHPAALGYYEVKPSGQEDFIGFVKQEYVQAASIGLMVEDHLHAVAPHGSVSFWMRWPTSSAAPTITNPRYRAAGKAWWLYGGWLQKPRDLLRTAIVDASREANVLTPLTSFIVVETETQWRLLLQKEKQKLANKDILEIQKAPEPGLLWLAAGFAAWFIARKSRASKRANVLATAPTASAI